MKEKGAEKKGLGLRPIMDKLIVKRVSARDVTKGGIVLPDSAKEKPKEGVIVALGEGRRLEDGKVVPFQVKVGDRVLFLSYAGSEVKLQDEEYLILEENDIMAVIKEE
ncbi:MAG: co-chaperone GroES [Planctomycetota bacterium]|nr:co-chaperone GroES [Planctomycetota bacterium]